MNKMKLGILKIIANRDMYLFTENKKIHFFQNIHRFLCDLK